MRLKTKFFRLGLPLAAALTTYLAPTISSAHEQYVLTKNQINFDIAYHGPSVFTALENWDNLKVALAAGLGSLLAIILYFFFYHSAIGQRFDYLVQKLNPFGEIVLRVALGASLIASAHFSAFLGPEIPLTSIPLGIILKPALYILGGLLIAGLFSEAVGLVSLIILLLATWVYKSYMISYFNYLGEFIALIIFGSRTFSLDKLIFNAKTAVEKFHDLETALIRVTYGVSIMYPAIVYKLIHPEVIIDIVARYDLNKFHWLFPHDPLLISLGGGLSQVAIGICLIFGFETRLNTLVTFVLMTMSVLFFKEAVWPHWVLLALALYLMINNGGKWSLDSYIQNNKEKLKAKLFRHVV